MKTQKTSIDALKSMKKKPQDVKKNLGVTAGGGQMPDPSDVPGGVLDEGEDMARAAKDAEAESQISADPTLSPEEEDEQSVSGSMPNPEKIEEKTTLDRSHDVGLYDDQSESQQGEIGIGEEVNRDEKEIRES